MRSTSESGVLAREPNGCRSCPWIASSVPTYRVLEVAGVTIVTASMALDAMELGTL